MFKIVNDLSHLNFHDFFVNRNLSYELRGTKDKIKPINNFKNTKWNKSFFNRVTNVWNALPNSITALESLPTFKRNIKKYDLSKFLDPVF